MVGNNKAIGSKVVEVTPTEWLPMHDGEMVSNPEKMEHKTNDVNGVQTEGAIITDQVIEATWMPAGTNRLTAPDVRRGVHVELWASADDDKYYWKSMGLDDNLHKLETIIFGISNTTDESITELTPEVMYWMEFSTHSKKIAISTSKSNGEPYLYEIFLDTEKGEFTVTDDIGNFINLQSKINLIHLQNAMGTFVKLDQKDIKAYAPKDIDAQAKINIQIKAGQNMNLEAGKNLTAKGGVLASIDGGGSKMTLTAAGTTLKTPHFSGSR